MIQGQGASKAEAEQKALEKCNKTDKSQSSAVSSCEEIQPAPGS